MKINHLDDRLLDKIRYVMGTLYKEGHLNGDAQRDLAHILHYVLDNVETDELPDNSVYVTKEPTP